MSFDLLEKQKKRVYKWPFHVKRLYRKWISEHANETWDTPSIHSCDLMSKETGVPAEKIRRCLKAYRIKVRTAEKKKAIERGQTLPNESKRRCINRQLDLSQREILRGWVEEHKEYPFPDDNQVGELEEKTGLEPEKIWKFIENHINVSRVKFPASTEFKHPAGDKEAICLWKWHARNKKGESDLSHEQKDDSAAELAARVLANATHIEKLKNEIEARRQARKEKQDRDAIQNLTQSVSGEGTQTIQEEATLVEQQQEQQQTESLEKELHFAAELEAQLAADLADESNNVEAIEPVQKEPREEALDNEQEELDFAAEQESGLESE
ncbi:unnamed protein product [Calypogeia fissa]